MMSERYEAEGAAAVVETPAATRAALLAAVDQLREVAADLARMSAGHTKVSDAVLEAMHAADAAKAVVASAADAEAIVAEVLGEAPKAPRRSAASARAELEAAEETLTQTRAARDLLQTRKQDAERSLGYAEARARSAAIATIRAHNPAVFAAFLAETAKLQDAIDASRRTLHGLIALGLVDQAATRALVQRIDYEPPDWRTLAPSPLLGKVEAMIGELCKDAKALARLP